MPNRGRVLIVEDDARVAAGLKELLEVYLYTVRVAGSVKAACEELVLDQFDVLVLDWILPDGDGREVMAFCREMSADVGIVVSSAHRSTDSECTPLADEFVEKGPDVTPIRNAVERAMRLAQERRERRFPPDPCRSDSALATAVLKLLNVPIAADGHFGVACDSESLSAMIARHVASKAYQDSERTIVELDATKDSGRDITNRLFGEAMLEPGRRPRLYPGVLDQGGASLLILRNADALPRVVQESVAESVATGSVRRANSKRGIRVDVRLAVTFAPPVGSRRKTKLNLATNMKRLLGKRMLSVPCLSEIEGGPGRVMQEYSRARCPGVDLLPGIEAIVDKGNWSSWDQLFPELRQVDEACHPDWDSITVPLFEASLFKRQEGDGQQIVKWKEVEDIPKALYICRVLGITRGNVKEAAEVSGIRRNTFYDVMRTYEISADQFREDSEARTSTGA
ncbi:MAG: response regulator [Planctomycetota bacterium]